MTEHIPCSGVLWCWFRRRRTTAPAALHTGPERARCSDEGGYSTARPCRVSRGSGRREQCEPLGEQATGARNRATLPHRLRPSTTSRCDVCSTFALANQNTRHRRFGILADMSSYEPDQQTDALSGAKNSGTPPEDSAPLQDAIQAWESEVKNRLSDLKKSADDVDEAELQYRDAQKTYRNLYRKAETDGIIRSIGKSALRDAGIPAPVTRRRKRKTTPPNNQQPSE